MKMFGYGVERVFDNTYSIEEVIGNNYLIVGSKKALLIDTGSGIGNIKGLTEKLSQGKPCFVVNTHGHYDHVYGDYQFTAIYIHRKDIELLKDSYKKETLIYNTTVFHDIYDSEEYIENLINCEPDFIIHELEEGMLFDLGDTTIEVIHTPRHSAGHVSFLDRENKRLFTGDSMMRHTTIANDGGTTIEEFISSLKKVYERKREFDLFIPAHGHRQGFRSLTPEYIEKLLRCIKQFDPDKALITKSELGNHEAYRYLLDDISYSDPESICITITKKQWEEYANNKNLKID